MVNLTIIVPVRRVHAITAPFTGDVAHATPAGATAQTSLAAFTALSLFRGAGVRHSAYSVNQGISLGRAALERISRHSLEDSVPTGREQIPYTCGEPR